MTRDFDETLVETKVMTYAVLPALFIFSEKLNRNLLICVYFDINLEMDWFLMIIKTKVYG